MNVFWTLMIGCIILVWILRLGYQMGYGKSKVKPTAKSMAGGSSKRWNFCDLLQGQVHYTGERVNKKEIFTIFAAALAIRLAVYLVSLIIMYINSDETTFALSDFLSNWNRWDAPHYIEIASNGYADHVENGQHLFLVFFPLYPWLLKVVHVFIADWELACLALSSLSYAVGCCFFYATVSEEYNKSIAYKSIVLLSVFPFAFFFGAMMTESLFFCTMAMGLYFIKKHNWIAVGIVGIFCSLCRIQGVLIMGVAGVEFLLTYPVITMYREKRMKEFFKMVFTKGIFLLLTPIGNLIYFYINYKVEGNPFQFTIYQSEHWYHDTTYFTNALDEIGEKITNADTTNSAIMSIWLPELLLFVLVVVLLIYGLKRHPLKYTAYLLVYTLICYSVTFLISGGRYMSCAFPLFIIAGEILDRHPKVYQWIVALSAMAMGMYLTGYFAWKQIM